MARNVVQFMDGDNNVYDVKDSTARAAIGVLEPAASASDVGKFLKVKTVTDGKVTEYEFGASSGGTTDYDDLTDKPQINSVTLSGHKSLSDLGIAAANDLSGKIDKPSSPSSGDFLCYNGTAWVATTLSVWQGGSY